MQTPEIAIIGHPNEGKSSVLSTLAEDDSVRISPTPGETRECRTFPVVIDGKVVLQFTDTPGFQNPGRILAELKKLNGNSDALLEQLKLFTASSPDLKDDYELLLPVTRGAGVIYVVDGARPLRNVDRAEMEILRLIGRPRMAVINCKNDDFQFLDSWKDELRKHFNSSRVFNAHRATYAERIELLEALKAIDQDWYKLLSDIVSAFRQDWQARTRISAETICSLLNDCLCFQLQKDLSAGQGVARLEQQLLQKYTADVIKKEKRAHQQIRALFKHNIFDYQLPPHSILREDLFNQKTWQLLGLTKKQLLLLGGIGGAAVGAGVDVAALGHGLGLFTALGGTVGFLGALLGRDNLTTDASFLGLKIAGQQIQIGPINNISLMFVLINRAFLYFQHTINWAHGRRDYPDHESKDQPTDLHGFTSKWSAQNLKTCNSFFKAVHKKSIDRDPLVASEMQQLLFAELMKISQDER